MYNFTSCTWTVEDTDRKRERLARISDTELLSQLEAAHYMCSPAAYWGGREAKRSTQPGDRPVSGSLFFWSSIQSSTASRVTGP